MPIVKPTALLESKKGLIILFIAEKGLYCIDKGDNLIRLTGKKDFATSGLNLQSAAHFFEESDSCFWMAVPGVGLYEYAFEKNRIPFLKNYFTAKNGLQSNNILSITCDKQNRLWLATYSGLDVLQKNDTGNWEIFNYARIDELGFTPSYYERLVTDSSGNIWLSSPDKILQFNPAIISLHKQAPHVIIEKVSLAFKETSWNKITDSLYSYFQLPFNPVLKYNQNSLGISFNAIDLSVSNSSPQYSYKLLPLDTAWSIPSKIKSVSFAQLPPERYQFMVRTKDMASGWSKPTVFRFQLMPLSGTGGGFALQ